MLFMAMQELGLKPQMLLGPLLDINQPGISTSRSRMWGHHLGRVQITYTMALSGRLSGRLPGRSHGAPSRGSSRVLSSPARIPVLMAQRQDLADHLDFSLGLLFQKEVCWHFGRSVHHPSSSPDGSFFSWPLSVATLFGSQKIQLP